MKLSTGFAYHPQFSKHNLGEGHPECPERVIRICSKLEESNLRQDLVQIHSHVESIDWVYKIHSQEHHDSVLSSRSGIPALKAVNFGLSAVDEVVSSRLKNAFCCLRPPGHHAHNHGANWDGSGQGEGFCFYSTIAVAAKYAQVAHGYSRILILDWDYHHGNGTEWAFYEDPSVMFFSTHAFYDYPGTGDPTRQGEGEGMGYNFNVALDRGAGDSEIIKAYESFLNNEGLKFNPDLILISAGFDSRENDPLGTFGVTDAGFSKLTGLVMDFANHCCEGKVVSFLEGGYNVEGLASAVQSHLIRMNEG